MKTALRESEGTSPKTSKQEAKLGFEPGKPGFIFHALGQEYRASCLGPFKGPHPKHLAYVGFSCFRITALDGLCRLSPSDSCKSRFPWFSL